MRKEPWCKALMSGLFITLAALVAAAGGFPDNVTCLLPDSSGGATPPSLIRVPRPGRVLNKS